MNNMKRFFCLLTSALLCFALLAGCGSSGRKWRDTDVIDAYGTVERDGEQIDVGVCHDRKAVYLYFNNEEHELFDTAMLPTDEIYDTDWLLGNIILDDFTGDNNSDLQVYLEHADMSESYIVWTWEKGEGYVYQTDYSRFYEPIVIYDPPYDDIANDFSMYEGIWMSEVTNQYDHIAFNADGSWNLCSGVDVIDEGYLWYDPECDTTYIHSNPVGAADGGQVELDGNRLYITTLGYFEKVLDEDDAPTRDISNSGNGNEYYNWNSELYQRNVSEFEGVWYYDDDLSAATFIIIDGSGNWSFFRRTSGDAEATETDHGTLSYSENESSTYYADSAINDGMRYRVYEFDNGIIFWDEATYYRMK